MYTAGDAITDQDHFFMITQKSRRFTRFTYMIYTPHNLCREHEIQHGGTLYLKGKSSQSLTFSCEFWIISRESHESHEVIESAEKSWEGAS